MAVVVKEIVEAGAFSSASFDLSLALWHKANPMRLKDMTIYLASDLWWRYVYKIFVIV